jgi:serine/threonine protein kinase
LKPENVVLADDGSAKLVDFGEAEALDGDIVPLTNPRGTMPFMAPEVLYLSEAWDPAASDVWALGVLLMEMLCGHSALTHIMKWQEKSSKPARECADELMAFFAVFDTSIAEEIVRDHSPDLSVLVNCELLAGMLNPSPQKRLSAAAVAKRVE